MSVGSMKKINIIGSAFVFGFASQMSVASALTTTNFKGMNSPEKTASRSLIEIPSAYIEGVRNKNRRNYTMLYTSCDYIIQNYYDRLDACSDDFECNPSDIPFPSTTQPIFQFYDGQPYFNSIFSNDDESNLVKTLYGSCKFEPRKSSYLSKNQARTEKGWMSILFNPSHSQWSSYHKRFLRLPAQSVVTASQGLSAFDPSMGVKRCGYDGVSNVTNGDYKQGGLISASNGISNTNKHYESLDYVIAGGSLAQNLGISTNANIDIKRLITDSLVGELHPTTPMIVGECNSRCTDPAFEVYSVPDRQAEFNLKKLSMGASQADSWYVKKIYDFKQSPDEVMPDGVLFAEEVKVNRNSVDEFGTTRTDYSLVLPGGALFGYQGQSFWVR